MKGKLRLISLSVLFLLALVHSVSSASNEETLASPDIVQDLIKKLFRLCGETESVSLWDCERAIVKNDKKMGNYRAGFNYTRETIYMMATFDKNDDGRLNYRELYEMGSEIMEGNAAEYRITRKLEELEDSGWTQRNMMKYFRPYSMQQIDDEVRMEKERK